jgi:hypothetical protein
VLAGVLVNVQMVRADRHAVRPHLSLQADGVARYRHNPRVLDSSGRCRAQRVRSRGRVLATGDPELARQARTSYQKLGVASNGTCVEPVSRCCLAARRSICSATPTRARTGARATRRMWSATPTIGCAASTITPRT